MSNRYIDENVIFSSRLVNVVSGIPVVVDLINDRLGNVFCNRLRTISWDIDPKQNRKIGTENPWETGSDLLIFYIMISIGSVLFLPLIGLVDTSTYWEFTFIKYLKFLLNTYWEIPLSSQYFRIRLIHLSDWLKEGR